MSTRYFVQSMEIKIRFPECLSACNILLTRGAPPDFINAFCCVFTLQNYCELFPTLGVLFDNCVV